MQIHEQISNITRIIKRNVEHKR